MISSRAKFQVFKVFLAFLALVAITVSPVSPFAAQPAGAAVADGSISFNGSNQDIVVPDSSAWDIGTADFTIEWFQKMTSTGSWPRIFSAGGYPSADLGASIEGGTLYFWAASGYQMAVSLPSDYLNNWKHVAITRSSGTLSIYVNGSRLGTMTNNVNINVTQTFRIGSEGGSGTYFSGQISNFHFVNGTAKYSGTSATVPTSPITAITNTKLLLKSVTSGTLLTDSSSSPKTLTATISPTWSSANPFDVPVVYTVSYNYNSATGGNSVSSANFTVGGSAITLPTPTRTGYTFGGWYSDSGLSTFVGSAGASYSPSATVTLYAKWTANTLTVTYNSNGGSDVSSVTTTTGGTISSAPTAPTRTGYSFAGWYSNVGLTVAANFPYAHGQTANFTLYAKWTGNPIVVTYESNGGSALASGSTATGATISAAPTAPTRSGYVFDGWYSDSGLTTSVSFPFVHGQTADFTLYAKWALGTYTVTYNYNSATGGNSTANASFTTGGTAITLPTPTRTGYSFAGWYSDAGLSNLAGAAGASISPTASSNLYAKWTADTLTVSFETNGGINLASTTTVTGGNLAAPSAPNRAGYSFAGWFSDSGLTTPVSFPFAHGQTSSFTLYAKWTAGTYAVTYNYNSATGGNSLVNSSFTTGDLALTLPTPTRNGYSFGGWFSDAGLSTLVGSAGGAYSPTSSETLYAKWTANTLTVSFVANGGSAVSGTTSLTGGTLTAPTAPTRVGYNFAGWYLDSALTASVSFPFVHGQTENFTLYAAWTAGTYTVTYNYNLATGGNSTPSDSFTSGTSAIVLPTPTRSNFEFQGWYDANTGGNLVGAAGASLTVSSNKNLYARWIQSSLAGLNPGDLVSVGVLTASNLIDTSFGATTNGSSVQVSVPAGAFVNGTQVTINLLTNFTQAQNILSDPHNYVLSLVVSWLAPDGTVPTTAVGKPVSMTISNASIKRGDAIYVLMQGTATLVGRAAVDGQALVSITDDPQIVIASTRPNAVTNVTATDGDDGSSTISWTAPNIDGGSAITGYTVTTTGGLSCTTVTTSCRITGLTNGTAYTFSVVATNAIGQSTSATSIAITPVAAVNNIQVVTPPVTTPPVTTPPVTIPVVTPPVTAPVEPPVVKPLPPVVAPTKPVAPAAKKVFTFASSTVGQKLTSAQVASLKALKASKGFTVSVFTRALLDSGSKKAMNGIASRVSSAIKYAFAKSKLKVSVSGLSKTPCKSPSGVCIAITATN
ncbi:MAG: Internalin-A precursor [Actinomycetota bacterium]|jgi:uncharacterized repeat protein (TIGR02543 family)